MAVTVMETVQQVEAKVIQVLAEKSSIPQEKITPTSSLVDDLGMDSLDAVEMVFSFEEHYGIRIPDEQISEFKKVKDVIDYLVQIMEKEEKP